MIPAVSYRAYRVWQRNRDVFWRLWRTEAVPVFVEPLLILVAIGWGLGSYVVLGGRQSYLEFIAPGIVASYAMFSASFECTYGSFTRMQTQKTYDAIISTPVSIEDVIAGETFWAATRALITAFGVMVIILAFGLVASLWAALVPVVAIAEGLMFGALAMFFTSLVPSIYSYNYYFELFITPMFFFSGVFFPLDSLPHWVQQLAWFLPLTHAVNLVRGLVTGEMTLSLLTSALWLAVVTAIFFGLSLVLMRRRLIK